VSRDDVSLSLCTAKQPPSPCTWLSHALSTMRLSDCLCVFDISLLFQLVNIYLLRCLFLNAWVAGHRLHPTRVVYGHIPEMCLLQEEHKGSPRFRRIPFDTVPLSETATHGGAQPPSPITDACMLLSSQKTLSASSTTTISGLTTFTCVAARYLLTTGFISFVTATDAV
jgi:hypothetical protein